VPIPELFASDVELFTVGLAAIGMLVEKLVGFAVVEELIGVRALTVSAGLVRTALVALLISLGSRGSFGIIVAFCLGGRVVVLLGLAVIELVGFGAILALFLEPLLVLSVVERDGMSLSRLFFLASSFSWV